MNVTIEELRGLLSAQNQDAPPSCCTADGANLGQCICVLDRGFVYVGTVEERSDRIIITGNSGKRHQTWAQSLGVDGYFNKPFRMERLTESIQQLLVDGSKAETA